MGPVLVCSHFEYMLDSFSFYFFSSKVQSALARFLRLQVLLRLHPCEGKGVSKIILTEYIFRFGALCHVESAVAGVCIDDHYSHPHK